MKEKNYKKKKYFNNINVHICYMYFLIKIDGNASLD